MRVSSQSQHSKSWISRHFGIHPRELGAARRESEGGKRLSVRENKKASEGRVKAKKEKASSKTGAKAATQKCRGMECKMVHVRSIHPPFFVLHRSRFTSSPTPLSADPPRRSFARFRGSSSNGGSGGGGGGSDGSHASIAG